MHYYIGGFMKKIFKTNIEYFNFYNKNKDKIKILKIKFNKTSICVNYEKIV